MYPSPKAGYIYRGLSSVPQTLRDYWALANCHYLPGQYVYQFGMSIRAILAVMVETVASMLIAPILMMTQSVAVIEILSGRDSGWKSQRRDDSAITLGEALHYHAVHMAVGAALALLCWNTTPELAIWMAPVIAGLLLSPLINWITARPAGPVMGWLLATREDREPAPTLTRATTLATAWTRRIDGGQVAPGLT